jgi:organic hydroperoxide reductase OsmC/OhrA
LVRWGILHYEARGVWDRKSGGRIHLPGLPDLRFDTPVRFGGRGRYACADQFFLSSLAACLIGTFLYFKNKLRFNPVRLEVRASARLALVRDRGYRVSHVKADFRVESKKDDLMVARRCADLAIAYCHLTQTIGDAVPITVMPRVRVHKPLSARRPANKT